MAGDVVVESQPPPPHRLPVEMALLDEWNMSRHGDSIGRIILDCSGVVGNTIADSTKVLDVAEDLVARGRRIEGGEALVLDVLQPIGVPSGSIALEGTGAGGGRLSNDRSGDTRDSCDK